MDRVPITSTNIKEVGYDATSNTLEILFKDGAIYRYLDVPQFVYDELLAAESAGRYFHQMIRDKYQFTRI